MSVGVMKDCKLKLGSYVSRIHWLRLIHKSATFVRISPYFDFSIDENAARRKWKYDDPKFDYAAWTPEAAKKRSVVRIEV
jgi:hypothetical protein